MKAAAAAATAAAAERATTGRVRKGRIPRHRHRRHREDPREEVARVGRKDEGVSGESVSVSMSVSWNAALTPPRINDTSLVTAWSLGAGQSMLTSGQ